MAAIVGAGFALFAGFLFLIGKNIGPWLLVTGVIMVCAYELFGAFQRAGLRPATLLGLTSCFALMWGAYAAACQPSPWCCSSPLSAACSGTC